MGRQHRLMAHRSQGHVGPALLAFFILMASLLGSNRCLAAITVRTTQTLTVFKSASFSSPVLATLPPESDIQVSDRDFNGFRRIRFSNQGQKRMGFVASDLLFPKKRPVKVANYAYGGGLRMTRYSQAGRSFSTKDNVTYKVSEFAGQSTDPEFLVTIGQTHFYRIRGIYRSVILDGQATTNISGSAAQGVRLEYKMVSLGLDWAYGFWNGLFYVGGGAEVSKALSGHLYYAGQDISSQDTTMPNYLTASAFGGVKFDITPHWHVFADARYGAAVNQSPFIFILEVGGGLLYRPE